MKLNLFYAILAAFLLSTPSSSSSFESENNAEESRLECKRYDKPELFFMCIQARSAKESAEILKRVEKKLPNFNEF